MVSRLIVACYTTGSIACLLLGAFAITFTFLRNRKHDKPTMEFFLTARRTVGFFMIGWSFYASVMGSWVLFAPGSYAYYAGITGLLMFSMAQGMSAVIPVVCGSYIHKLVPDVCSFSDFVRRRFGVVVQVYCSMVSMLILSLFLTAEFTAVGDVFSVVNGTVRWPIVVLIAVVTTSYTSYGGLYVSIVTDQVQAHVANCMVIVLAIYVAVTFRNPLQHTMPENLRLDNYMGLSAIACQPLSVLAANMFTEAMWQRVWASATKKDVVLGATMGFFSMGFFGS